MTRGGRRLGATWAMTLLVLAGLFSMHGLSTHGSHVGAAAVASSAHGSVTDFAGQNMAYPAGGLGATVTDAAGGAPRHGLPRPPGPAGGASGLLWWCLALLSVGALMLLLVRERHGQSTLWLRPCFSAHGRVTPTGRDPAPPCRSQLSVWRC